MFRVLRWIGILAILALVVFVWRRGGEPRGAAVGALAPDDEGEAATADGPEPASSEEQGPAAAHAAVERAPLAQEEELMGGPTTVGPKLVLRARILDPLGRPIPGANLIAADVEGRPTVESGSDGWAQLELDWPMRLTVGNSHWAVIEAGGEGLTRVRRQEAIDGPGEVQFGEIRLTAGGQVTGRVLDHDGKPPQRASVFLVQGAEAGDPALEDLRRTRAEGFGHVTSGGTLYGETDAEGRYTIEGVPPASVSVVCRARDRYVAYTPPIEVRLGEGTQAPDLVLEPVRDENTIRGVVLDELGEPLGGAMISAFENRGARNIDPQAMGGSARVDGSFELVVPLNQRFTLQADHPVRRGMFVLAHDVDSGSQGLTLRFPVERTIEIHLLDADGNSVEKPRASFADESGQGMGMRTEALEGGGIAVSLPAVPFYVYAGAPGYLGQRLGPFDPADVPARIEAVLERAGALRGRVIQSGRPVAGAKVHVHTPPEGEPFSRFSEQLFTHLGGTYWNREEVETDGEGRFEIFLHKKNAYTLHAEAEGFARAESPVYSLQSGESAEGIELELGPSATIEGRVLVAEGVERVGILVGATRGDGHVELCETTPDGSYRFEGLAAGGWQLARCSPGVRRSLEMGRTWPAPELRELPVHVRLAVGETVRYDLDLSDERLCVLRGSLAFDGVAAKGWNARLETQDVSASSTIGDDGRFELQIRTSGSCSLVLNSGSMSGGELSLFVPLVLEAGENVWQRDFDTGRLKLEGLPPATARGDDHSQHTYELQWVQRENEATLRFGFEPNRTSALEVEGLPAGRVTLHRRVREEGQRHSRSFEVQSFEIAAGRLTSLTYDED